MTVISLSSSSFGTGERMSASQRWEEESTAAGCILLVVDGPIP